MCKEMRVSQKCGDDLRASERRTELRDGYNCSWLTAGGHAAGEEALAHHERLALGRICSVTGDAAVCECDTHKLKAGAAGAVAASVAGYSKAVTAGG